MKCTVKDLIEALSKQNPSQRVILASDSEGNNTSPWDGYLDHSLYITYEDGCGELCHQDDMDDDELEDNNFENVVVLYPVR